MQTRDFGVVAAVLVSFAALSAVYSPVTGLTVSMALGFFLVAAYRYRGIRW